MASLVGKGAISKDVEHIISLRLTIRFAPLREKLVGCGFVLRKVAKGTQDARKNRYSDAGNFALW